MRIGNTLGDLEREGFALQKLNRGAPASAKPGLETPLPVESTALTKGFLGLTIFHGSPMNSHCSPVSSEIAQGGGRGPINETARFLSLQ